MNPTLLHPHLSSLLSSMLTGGWAMNEMNT
jgi:hypothetical protein